MNIKDVENGVKFYGKRQLLKYLQTGKVSLAEAVLAKCYECMCGFEDGCVDCEIPDCPLYPFMRAGKAYKNREKKPHLVEHGKNLKKKSKEQSIK